MLSWVLLLGVLGAKPSCSAQPEVLLQQGQVRGMYEKTFLGREIASFWGIPYAKPPVGKHRFKQSVPLVTWQGVLNATQHPPECLQYSHLELHTRRPTVGQEDCLYLNVFTPKLPSVNDGRFLDVLVYIHGGAFMFLTSSEFKPYLLLDRDIVMVTLNYRLGPLGFLSTGDYVVPGNNGLKDQVLALTWVKDNIAAFGGDPTKVTIAGMSAGSASVHYHLLSPLSKGLFYRAIMMSGSALNPWAEADGVPEKTKMLATHLGCPTNESLLMVRCLRHRPAQHIVSFTSNLQSFEYNPFSPWAPVVESENITAFLSTSPAAVLAEGLAHDVPILASITEKEGLYPGGELTSVPGNLQYLSTHLKELLPHLLHFNWTIPLEEQTIVSQKIIDHYGINLPKEDGVNNFIKMVGDRLFNHGVVKAMIMHSQQGTSPLFLYRFSHKGKFSISSSYTEKYLGVCHSDDQFYVIPTKHSASQDTEKDRVMTRYMVNLWADFAITGNLEAPWVSGDFHEMRGPDQVERVGPIELGSLAFWDTLGFAEHQILTPARDEL